LCYRLTHLYILYMSKHFGMANTKFIAYIIRCCMCTQFYLSMTQPH